MIKLDINLFSYENIKYFFYSLIFIPITFGIKLVVHNILIACVLEGVICALVYAGILVVTKDPVFFELTDKIFKKMKLKR